MHYRYRILTVIMAVLLIAVLSGCDINNSSGDLSDGRSDEESEEVETAEEDATVSAPLERPSQPEQTQRPERTPQPGISLVPATGDSGFDVGDVLPDFSVPLAGGGTFTLSENLGKPVFINLFATWCGPCVGEMPEIDELYQELSGEVSFVIIDIGEDEATAQDFVDSNGYSLPAAYSLDGAPFGDTYYVEYIPQTFVLSANGTIVSFFGGSSDYDSFMAAISDAMAQ